jgi:hypothetical protein
MSDICPVLESIRLYAKQLRIPSFTKYNDIVRYADGGMGDEEFLLELMKKELETRRENQQKRRTRAAGFPFPEVYISGYGWMVFEPTVEFGGSQDKFSIFFSSIFNKIKNIVSAIWRFILDMPFWFKLLFIPYIVFSLLFVIWLYFWIRRSIWKNKVLSEEKSQAISMVFAKISNLLKKIGLEIDKHETPSCYAIRIFEASGIDLLGFVESFSKCKYGGIEPDEKTILYSIEIYNEVRQVVKKRVGRLKSWVL